MKKLLLVLVLLAALLLLAVAVASADGETLVLWDVNTSSYVLTSANCGEDRDPEDPEEDLIPLSGTVHDRSKAFIEYTDKGEVFHYINHMNGELHGIGMITGEPYTLNYVFNQNMKTPYTHEQARTYNRTFQGRLVRDSDKLTCRVQVHLHWTYNANGELVSYIFDIDPY